MVFRDVILSQCVSDSGPQRVHLGLYERQARRAPLPIMLKSGSEASSVAGSAVGSAVGSGEGSSKSANDFGPRKKSARNEKKKPTLFSA